MVRGTLWRLRQATACGKYRAHAARASHTLNSVSPVAHTQRDRMPHIRTTHRQHIACPCAAHGCPPMHEPLPVRTVLVRSAAQSRVPGSYRGPRTASHAPAPRRPGAEALALHNKAQGQGHNAHGTSLMRALELSTLIHTQLHAEARRRGTRSCEWCTVVWRGAPSYSIFSI